MPRLETISLADLEKAMETSDIEHQVEQIDLTPIVQQLMALVQKRSDNKDILAKISELVTSVKDITITVQPTDLKPILDAVRLIKKEPPAPVIVKHNAVAYRAVVHRDNRNDIETVDFIPLET